MQTLLFSGVIIQSNVSPSVCKHLHRHDCPSLDILK